MKHDAHGLTNTPETYPYDRNETAAYGKVQALQRLLQGHNQHERSLGITDKNFQRKQEDKMVAQGLKLRIRRAALTLAGEGTERQCVTDCSRLPPSLLAYHP